MHVETPVLVQPVVDRGCLVGRQVVADQVYVELCGYGLVDRDQEFFEFDCPMAGVELGNDGAVGGRAYSVTASICARSAPRVPE